MQSCFIKRLLFDTQYKDVASSRCGLRKVDHIPALRIDRSLKSESTVGEKVLEHTVATLTKIFQDLDEKPIIIKEFLLDLVPAAVVLDSC